MLHNQHTRIHTVVQSASLASAITLLVFGALISGLIPNRVDAASSTCSITDLNPHSAPTGTDTGFSFTVTSPDTNIAWIQVISPNANLVIYGGSSDWLPTVTYDDTEATFTGGPIASGNPLNVNVVAHILYFPPSNWTVKASGDASGAGAVTCSGDASITISDTTPPNILTLSASAQSTSANILWTTDKLTNARVDYGLNSSYGSTVTNGSYDTSHNVLLSNLKPSTLYHYQVTSVDQAGNSVSSNDGTFATAAVPPPITVTVPVITPVITDVADKTPPTIMLTTTIPRVFTTMPTLSGIASDNVGVSKIEYSTDNGKDWLSVDTTTGIGGKQVTFSFTPINLDDDTYAIKARAIDAGGNISTTDAIQVVIDRLPPIVGGSVISLGPQILNPDSNGILRTLAGVNLKVTLSAVGGATRIDVNAVNTDSKTSPQSNFSLTRSSNSGLWNGLISFTNPGNYQLIEHALDGAGNTTTRNIANIVVIQPGHVVSANGPVVSAQVTTYFLDQDTDNWAVWDGRPYGQDNPQRTDMHGSYTQLLPAGTYYISVKAGGYQPVNSSSFTLTKPSPVSAIFHLNRNGLLGSPLLSWLPFGVQKVSPTGSTFTSAFTMQPLTGKVLSGFSLTDTTGHVQSPVNWLGKPTVMTVMSSWAPTTAEQVQALHTIASNHDINVELVGLQENAPRLRAYSVINGTSLPWLADPDSTLTPIINTNSMPTHYFVDRKGVIKQVITGVLSAQQLMDALTNVE